MDMRDLSNKTKNLTGELIVESENLTLEDVQDSLASSTISTVSNAGVALKHLAHGVGTTSGRTEGLRDLHDNKASLEARAQVCEGKS